MVYIEEGNGYSLTFANIVGNGFNMTDDVNPSVGVKVHRRTKLKAIDLIDF